MNGKYINDTEEAAKNKRGGRREERREEETSDWEKRLILERRINGFACLYIGEGKQGVVRVCPCVYSNVE